jgi:hypothetical protein
MIRMVIDATIGDTWDTILTCPTCGSIDRDVFLPIVATVMRCDNPWHEDRIIKKPRHKSGEAAARQSQVFWPSGFTVHYSNG